MGEGPSQARKAVPLRPRAWRLTEPQADAPAPGEGDEDPGFADLTAEPPRRGGTRWIVARGDRRERVDPDDGRDVRRVARILGASPDVIRGVLLRAMREAVPARDEPEPTDPTQEPEVAAWREGDTTRVTFPSLGRALSEPQPAWDYLGWDGRELAAVDVDLTDAARARGFRFEEPALQRLLFAATPIPRYSWRSRSGGYRGIFGPCARYGLTALERAGLWVLLSGPIVRHVAVAKTELVSVTRVPPRGSVVLRSALEYGVRDLRGALLRTGGREAASDQAIEGWLARAGMVVGQRYPHSFCPIDPTARGGRNPVIVTPEGVRCFRHQTTVPWSRLVAGDDLTRSALDPLVSMAQELVHWTHAQIVLDAERPGCDPRFLRAGYRALVRVLHWEQRDDEAQQKREAALWSPDRAYLRSRGLWIRSDDYKGHVPSRAAAIALPWSRGRADRVDRLLTDADLEGYVPIEPVLHLVDAPTWRGDVVLAPQDVPESQDPFAELTLPEAWDQLRQALPGVTDEWLRASYLLTVAALRAQLRLAQPPTVAIKGASGAGKGAMTALVGGILGYPAAHLHFDGAKELGMAIGQGLERRAPILFGDEIGKAEGWWAQSAALLRLGPVHEWRKLHAGYVATPVRSAVVLAGSTFPQAFWGQRELVRRVALVTLSGLSDRVTAGWEAQARSYLEIPRLEDLRTSGLGVAIANAYVQAARAEVLRPDLPDWVTQAVGLGAERLSEADAIRERAELVRSLYRIWCDGPDEALVPDGARAGWLRCWRIGQADEAAALMDEWLEEADSDAGRRGKLYEIQTDEVLPGVQLVVRQSGRRVALRFQSGTDRSLDRRNRGLFPALEETP